MMRLKRALERLATRELAAVRFELAQETLAMARRLALGHAAQIRGARSAGTQTHWPLRLVLIGRTEWAVEQAAMR